MDPPICCLCGGPVEPWPGHKNIKGKPYGYGHNPWPLSDGEDDRCCNTCNDTKVLPVRIQNMIQNRKNNS